MRFLLRVAVLALAAVGAKALYDRFAPRAAEMRGPASDVYGSAKDAARDITEHARAAASDVVDDAKQRAADVRDQASAAVDQAPGAAPPVTPATSRG